MEFTKTIEKKKADVKNMVNLVYQVNYLILPISIKKPGTKIVKREGSGKLVINSSIFWVSTKLSLLGSDCLVH